MILEVLPAKKGDCLLLHAGDGNGPGLIVIDGGPAGVGKTLINRLVEIRDERGLAPSQPLVIDVLMVSHVDDDHINGVIDLLEAMKERRDIDRQPPLFRILDLWHNSFDRIVGNEEATKLATSPQFGAASTFAAVEEGEEEDGARLDAAKVLAGVAQGDQLRNLADDLGIPINAAFGGGLIRTETGTETKRTIADIEFTVIGPHQPELEALEKDFDEWLESQPPDERTAPAFLAGLDDKSVANLSSIVLIAREGSKSILLTGDARSDKIIEGLENCGAMAAGGSLDVSVLKMPHHGSIRNLDAEFARRVTSGHYVFSGDGKHGNPDRETFELLMQERPLAEMTFHLTYKIPDIDAERKKEFDKSRAKRIAKGKPPGPAWSAHDHSLADALALVPVNVTVKEGAPTRL